MYNDVREGCELTASSEVLEALQREAQQVRVVFSICFVCALFQNPPLRKFN